MTEEGKMKDIEKLSFPLPKEKSSDVALHHENIHVARIVLAKATPKTPKVILPKLQCRLLRELTRFRSMLKPLKNSRYSTNLDKITKKGALTLGRE